MRIILNNKLRKSKNFYSLAMIATDYDEEIPDGFSIKFMTVFDHWLDEDEAYDQIILYDQVQDSKDIVKKKKYFEYENKFLEFYKKLYSNYKVLGLVFNQRSQWVFMEFDNVDELITQFKNGIRTDFFWTFIIPEINLLINTRYDFIHQLIFPVKSKEKIFSELNRLVKESGLYILD